MKEYTAQVKDRKLVFADRNAIGEYVAANFQDGEYVLFTIQKFKDTKTDRQHRYWFGPILDGVHQVFKDAGYHMTKGQARQYFESEVLPYNKTYMKIGLKEEQIMTPFRDLNKEDMTLCIDFAIQWCAENGVQVLTPEEYYLSIGLKP